MAEPRLLRRLDQVASRLRTRRGLWAGTIGWGLLAILILVLSSLGRPSLVWAAVIFSVPAILFCMAVVTSRRNSDRHRAAVLIEKTYPELDSRLITAVEQQPADHHWDFSYLQSELLTQVFSQLRQQNWHKTVSLRQLRWAYAAHAASLLVCLSFLWPLLQALPQQSLSLQTISQSDSGNADFLVSVEPGDVELERGSPLLVLARFPERVPGHVDLVAVSDTGKEIRIPLQKSLDDPVFGGRIPFVEEPLNYRVEFEENQTEEFRVSTFEFPGLVKADAHLKYPDFTKLEPKTIENVRKVTLVEGSTLELRFELNKEVRSARLVDAKEQSVSTELLDDPDNQRLKSAHWKFSLPGEHRFQLLLRDEQGRTNPDPEEFQIVVVPNHAPDLKVVFPSKDLKVSPLQELQVNANASDDFGLTGLGLIYQTSTGIEKTIDFSKSAPADEVASAEHLLTMEQLNVRPDDVVTYYFYADDIGPDGTSRRSFSDIFFAEVRHFEEIYRQAPESPSSSQQQRQQQGPSSPTEKLIDLQRQVVTASWNIIRKTNPDRLNETFVNQVRTLVDSQIQIQQLAQDMKSQLQDELLKQHLTEAIRQMHEAARSFEESASQTTLEPMSGGRMAAQSAYQNLLKMQARENVVARSQSSQGQQGEQNRQMNQQMEALQLKNDRNRYETERQAQPQQAAAEQETLQIFNRLKELARRQEDLNQRVRELETALREAETQEEKKELQRQLQRLQAEQEEMLRDLDDVREKMSQEQNRQQMSEAREKADATRERVMRASEALKQGQTSRALTEGTRAERQLENLKEDFRKKAAGQFDQALRELRNDVRELSQHQQELSEKLGESPAAPTPQRRSLKEPEAKTGSQEFAEEFEQQKKLLTDVLDRTRSLVEESEESEPLLSKKLYETVRELRKFQPLEALDAGVQLAERGIRNQLPVVEKQAREGIEHLQSGIEEAARSVLGDEESALRQAQAELSQLREAIERELAMNELNSSDTSNSSPSQTPAPTDGTPGEQGEPAGADQQPGGSANGMRSTAQETRDQESEGPSSSSTTPDASERSMRSTDRETAGGEPEKSPDSSSESSNPTGNNGARNREESPRGSSPSRNPQQQGGGQPETRPSSAESPSGESPSEQSGEGSGSSAGGASARSTPNNQSSPSARSPEGNQPGQRSPSTEPQPGNSLTERLQQMLGGGGGNSGTGSGPENAPLTGESYTQWSNRLQDVEELLTTPELRAQAAAIRDRARQERVNVKRHSKAPDWELVRTSIYGPLVELETRIGEELARRQPDKKLVPIDRDPVPEKYSEFVRSYYEQLSRQQPD